jgi:hypothetical protein
VTVVPTGNQLGRNREDVEQFLKIGPTGMLVDDLHNNRPV